jgi:hypothetical protein
MRMTIFALALALAAGAAQAQGLTLKGPAGHAQTLSAAEFAALPHVKVDFDAHGTLHHYEGVPVLDLLARVGAPTGKAVGGKAMADVILVSAADGYRVALGLAEADPGTRANRIIVADRDGGLPLGAKQGPFQLVVEGDVRPARSARMVKEIEVVSLAGH